MSLLHINTFDNFISMLLMRWVIKKEPFEALFSELGKGSLFDEFLFNKLSLIRCAVLALDANGNPLNVYVPGTSEGYYRAETDILQRQQRRALGVGGCTVLGPTKFERHLIQTRPSSLRKNNDLYVLPEPITYTLAMTGFHQGSYPENNPRRKSWSVEKTMNQLAIIRRGVPTTRFKGIQEACSDRRSLDMLTSVSGMNWDKLDGAIDIQDFIVKTKLIWDVAPAQSREIMRAAFEHVLATKDHSIGWLYNQVFYSGGIGGIVSIISSMINPLTQEKNGRASNVASQTRWVQISSFLGIMSIKVANDLIRTGIEEKVREELVNQKKRALRLLTEL